MTVYGPIQTICGSHSVHKAKHGYLHQISLHKDLLLFGQSPLWIHFLPHSNLSIFVVHGI